MDNGYIKISNERRYNIYLKKYNSKTASKKLHKKDPSLTEKVVLI